jgi:murein DD-endopeptidase MepM/ murein hydrolase activator NlpD
MLRTRLPVLLILSAVALAAFAAVGPAATADTASDLAAARQKVAETQAEANAAADESNRAQSRYEELEQTINDLEAVIQASEARATVLEDVVRRRAQAAYVQHGTSDLDAVWSAESPLDASRRARLLDHANQNDNLAVKKLAAIRADLSVQKKKVDAQRDEQRQVKARLDEKNASVQARLAAASQARDELAARLEREQAVAAYAAELARLRAIQAASALQASSTGNDGGGPGVAPGQVIANPGGGAFQCPVAGSAYSNSYGPRGSGFHYGIDMMAPTGTPEVAVKAGTVSYVPMGGAGGNEAYLAADDGNVYYYAHMSQFVGGARSVAQGEVIGLVGSTGSSSAPHLHFEIRIGGANGQRINPYPTLQGAGC